MNKILILLIGICLISLVSGIVCDDDNDILATNIPCEAITPSNILCSENVSIIYVPDASINYSINMSLKYPASNIYNFSFNYNTTGQYYVTLCDNTTATVMITYVSPVSTYSPSITSLIRERTEDNETLEDITTLSEVLDFYDRNKDDILLISILGFVIIIILILAIIFRKRFKSKK